MFELLVPRGSAFGYLGPNGAGKTTLIRTLLGLTRADAGTMSLLGIPVPAERSRALARVGAIVDEPRFHPHLTGRDNLRLLAAARGGDADQRIAPSLARVGLADRAGDKVASYSMGMRQRLGVAACLLGDPELLILDEPMNGLDPAGIHEMRAMIASLADEGRTVVLSLSDAGSSADRSQGRTPIRPRAGTWMPTWGLITTKHLELRKRRGLMVVVALLTIGPPVLILGLRLLFHAADPASYGPAGTPNVFSALCNLMAQFGFIVAAVLGAATGTTDLTEGVFRNLVITGRSRLALYLARIPAGLAILLPIVALAFAMVCLVTSYEGTPQPTSVSVGGVSVPAHLDQAGLQSWLLQHPRQAADGFPLGPATSAAQVRSAIDQNIAILYGAYTADEFGGSNPAVNEMAKIGLWIELEAGIGFMVGLGLGSLTGQRTLTTILLIGLEIVVTPILAAQEIPYFLNGQRLVVGVATDQLRPAALASGSGPHGPGRVLFGGRGALGIPPMPTWAMISVIVGWIVGWSVIGAWRMMSRDA